jgi:hypothetical protein
MNLKAAAFIKAALVFALVGCVNITINFPAAEVEAAAKKIERDIRSAPTAPPASPFMQRRAPVFGSGSAYAADINLKVDSATIRSLTAARKARYPQLKPYLDSGAIGEGRSALLVVRSIEGLDARSRVTLNQLVSAENKDRTDLFKQIIALNNLADSDLPKVQAAFAAAIRSEMERGQWFENERGGWEQKQ